ncbi:MAG TPA: hypothetical protein VF618_25055 [Thermoanaerobaculia bacterium]
MSRRLTAPLILFLIAASCLAAGELDPQLRMVEQIRGRKFVTGVKNVTIDRSELPKRLEEQMKKELPYSTEDWITILRSLQLVERDTKDVLPKLIALYESQVLAYYDPKSHTYYSIKQLPKLDSELPIDPKMLEESVVIHELMHALQDQHWNIGEKTEKLKREGDAAMAYHALLEGEASFVMMAHLLGKMGVPIDELVKNDAMLAGMASAAASQAMASGSDTPKYFTESLGFPYLKGLEFVIAAYKRGGWKELDKVHANPPKTTREILHPEEYFEKKVKHAELPLKNWQSDLPGLISVERLGEFHWTYLLGKDAARGLTGDRVAVAKNGAVVAETVWETPERAKIFADAYTTFLKGRGLDPKVTQDGATVRASYVAR